MDRPWIDKSKAARSTKPMARAPVSLDGQVGAELGRVLELQLSEHLVTFNRKKPRLVWFTKSKALGWWQNLKAPRSTEAHMRTLDAMGVDTRRAVRTFVNFNDRYESGAYTVEFPLRSTQNWYSIDRAYRIKYWSDKWATSNVDWVHDFRAGTRLYIYGNPRSGPSFWILRGGGLKVGKRGID